MTILGFPIANTGKKSALEKFYAHTGDKVFVHGDEEVLTREIADDGMHSSSDREYSSTEEEPPAKNMLHLCYFKRYMYYDCYGFSTFTGMSSNNSAVNGLLITPRAYAQAGLSNRFCPSVVVVVVVCHKKF